MEVAIVALLAIGAVSAVFWALIHVGFANSRKDADRINREEEEEEERRRNVRLALAAEEEKERAFNAAAKGLPVTTALSIPGRETESVLRIVAAEVVLGMNIFMDLGSGVRDIVGGRGQALQKAFREARELCITEMQVEAHRLGADAVIAVDLDYNHLSSNLVAGGMVFVAATGTAVKLAPQPPSA